MNAIIEHVCTPDELAHQGFHGIDAFTAEELERLQQKDEAALRRANACLEQRVRARTAELAQTNAALQAEIQAHKQAEHERTQLLVREQALRRELEVAVATLRTSEQRFRRLFEANIIGIAFSDFSSHEIEDSGRLRKSSRVSLCRDVDPGNSGVAGGPGGLRAYV
jgi:hypothetical protein